MKKVKVGLIGCGGIGTHHLQNLLKMKSVSVVAACDINGVTLLKFGVDASLPKKVLYRDYTQLLKQKEIEAVIICLPTNLHSKVTIEAFEAGKHVFCEKPVAINLSSANTMIEAAKRNKKKLQIGLQSRFRSNAQVLKLHIDHGELGEIYYGKCAHLRRSGIPGWGSWFTRRVDAGAGPILDIGIHALDLTLWLMSNFKPLTAFASSYSKFGPNKMGLGEWGTSEPDGYFDVEDLAIALLKLENGASVLFEVSWASHIAKPLFHVKLFGNKGGLDLESTTIFTTELGNQVDKKLYIKDTDPYLAEMEHFMHCILEDKEPITRYDEMLGLQRALDMILKSSLEKRVISADEV